jgi:hypothetical protein
LERPRIALLPLEGVEGVEVKLPAFGFGPFDAIESC